MKTDKTIKYNTFIKNGLDCFWIIFNQTFDQTNSKKEIEKLKRKYQDEIFDDCFQDFRFEFEDNVLELTDRKSIYYYLEDCFGEWDKWEGFEPEIERTIIRSHFQVEFLLKLNKTLQRHIANLKSLIYIDPLTKNLSFNFEKSFYDAIFIIYPDYEMPTWTLDGHKSEIYFKYDNRFDFDSLNFEYKKLKSKQEKIQMIEDRLIEFSLWQVQYDELIHEDGIKSFRYFTQTYYPKFEELCNLQLSGLNKQARSDNNLPAAENEPVIIQEEDQSSDFIWKDTDTDMLELAAALYKKGSIQRKDGKPINRNEIVEMFETLFSFKIKDVEGKLTRATARVDNTPFLDRLKIAFKNFGVEKEAKYKKLHGTNKK